MHEIKEAVVDAILRDYIHRNRRWIEQTLSMSLAATLQLELPYTLSKWATRYFLPEGLDTNAAGSSDEDILNQITHVLLPPDALPVIKIDRTPKPVANGRSFGCYWSSEWRDGALALCIKGIEHPIVVVTVAYKLDNRRLQNEVVIVRRDSVQALITQVEANRVALHGPRIHHYPDEPVSLQPADWDDVIMDDKASKLLRDDFLSFFERREWFHAKKLPFRRGYLLHGPPGNGKTSAVRAMLSHPGVTGYSIDLMARFIDDGDLRKFFKEAAANAPALILFEDIDRFFARKPEEDGSQVSMQQLLNCLDGVDTLDGVIVVATANNPEALDTAILRRPGRFDRVVEFGNPSEKLRARYFHSLCSNLTADDLDLCALASKGLSFAQLREAFILAAQTAFEARREVLADDIVSAFTLLQTATDRADRRRTQKPGFEADSRKLPASTPE